LPIDLGLGRHCPAINHISTPSGFPLGSNILATQSDVLQDIILPQIPGDEVDGFLEALSEFEGLASDYFKDIDPDNLAPIGIGWQSRSRIMKILERPGFQAALGICGSCLVSAITGNLSPFDIGARIFSTDMIALPPIDAPREGLLRYMAVSPDLRTHFTDLMIRLEQTIDRLLKLTPEDLTPIVVSQIAGPKLISFIELAFIDLKELLFEHDTLTILLYNTVQNILFGGDPDVPVYRVHFNMTTMNEMDPTNHHGNVYLRVIKAWFQEKFGTIHVVQNPERTSFQFITRSSRQVRQVMNSFELEVRHRIATALGVDEAIVANFVPRAVLTRRKLTLENLYYYGIRSDADIETFRELLEFGEAIDVKAINNLPKEQRLQAVWEKALNIRAIVETGDKRLIKIVYAVIIRAITELNAELAAQTTFFEKEVGFGKLVYLETELPEEGEPLYPVWQEYLNDRTNFVGPGQYDPAYFNPKLNDPRFIETLFFDVGLQASSSVNYYSPDSQLSPAISEIVRTIPPLRRIQGHLSHRRPGSDGGVIERFARARKVFLAAQESERAESLTNLQEVGRELLDAFRNFYRWAVRDPRNLWTQKQHETFGVKRGEGLREVPANFFIQEVALAGNTYIMELEYDSFRAYSGAHGEHDIQDKDFNRVRDAVWLAAAEMNMPMPIVNPSGGDHISVSFSNADLDGQAIDPAVYSKLVQQIIVDRFKDKPFQDLSKVAVREFRLTGDNLGRLDDPHFREAMRLDLGLAAQPQLTAATDSYVVFAVSSTSRSGDETTMTTVKDYLETKGIGVDGEALSIEKLRLLMWTKIGGSAEDPDYWVYGNRKPEGYEPFSNTLSVTIAIGEHRPIRVQTDIGHFIDTVHFVGGTMDKAKTSGLPYKGEFVDVRAESPIHRVESDVPSTRPPSVLSPSVLLQEGLSFLLRTADGMAHRAVDLVIDRLLR